MLDCAGNTHRQAQLGLDFRAGKTQPLREPVPVGGDRPRAGQLAVQQVGQRLDHLQVFALLYALAHIHHQPGFFQARPAGRFGLYSRTVIFGDSRRNFEDDDVSRLSRQPGRLRRRPEQRSGWLRRV